MNNILIIAEIGINHNGDLSLAKKLIKGSKDAGADAVKFQKRTIDLVYTEEDLNKYRESPWGTTNRQQKEGLEFGKNDYDEIKRYCDQLGIEWLASAWDIESQNFLKQYDLKYNKIASAMLTYKDLLDSVASEGKYTFISTGMSSLKEIEAAVQLFRNANCPFELMHCNSSYPMKDEHANLNTIPFLQEHFNCNVGYSGHEVGLGISIAASALGITSLERHVTLDRSMYGSDQSSSVELSGFSKLVDYVRIIEKAMGEKGKKIVFDDELAVREKLRRHSTLVI